MRQLKDLVVLGCPFHSEAEAGKDGMRGWLYSIIGSAVKFVHPWETNSGCIKRGLIVIVYTCRWKHYARVYVQTVHAGLVASINSGLSH